MLVKDANIERKLGCRMLIYICWDLLNTVYNNPPLNSNRWSSFNPSRVFQRCRYCKLSRQSGAALTLLQKRRKTDMVRTQGHISGSTKIPVHLSCRWEINAEWTTHFAKCCIEGKVEGWVVNTGMWGWEQPATSLADILDGRRRDCWVDAKWMLRTRPTSFSWNRIPANSAGAAPRIGFERQFSQ